MRRSSYGPEDKYLELYYHINVRVAVSFGQRGEVSANAADVVIHLSSSRAPLL